MNYKKIIEELYLEIKSGENKGEPATYIPELANVETKNFGIHILTTGNDEFGVENYTEKFSIQSIAKVLSLSLAYKLLGEKIWERLGVEPSGTPFNSLVQLETDKGIPRNPFINSGALVICDILITQLDNPKEDFLEFIRDISDNPELNYSIKIAESEKSEGYLNVALCNFIKSFGNIKNDTEDVLDFYFNLCSLEMSCQELSGTFMFLANDGHKITDNSQILCRSKTKRINALMQTCGFYDESGEFTFKVGLPGKSGVGGGVIAIHPNNYSIAVWSPKLNKKGNSYRGMKFLELFTTKTELSIF
ncbi:MAG: glutaminase [Bacteroidota bacterium]